MKTATASPIPTAVKVSCPEHALAAEAEAQRLREQRADLKSAALLSTLAADVKVLLGVAPPPSGTRRTR